MLNYTLGFSLFGEPSQLQSLILSSAGEQETMGSSRGKGRLSDDEGFEKEGVFSCAF